MGDQVTSRSARSSSERSSLPTPAACSSSMRTAACTSRAGAPDMKNAAVTMAETPNPLEQQMIAGVWLRTKAKWDLVAEETMPQHTRLCFKWSPAYELDTCVEMQCDRCRIRNDCRMVCDTVVFPEFIDAMRGDSANAFDIQCLQRRQRGDIQNRK